VTRRRGLDTLIQGDTASAVQGGEIAVIPLDGVDLIMHQEIVYFDRPTPSDAAGG
jgi:hypothetical protein